MPGGYAATADADSLNGTDLEAWTEVAMYFYSGNGSQWWARWRRGAPMQWASQSVYNTDYVFTGVIADSADCYYAECRSDLVDGYAELYAES